jgi:TRAP-type C4-dicarboxylate transport system permease small subunit
MPRGLALWLLRLGDLLWIVFNLFVLVGGILYLGSILEYPYRAMITDINMFWIFLPIPVIFLVFTLRVAFNLFDPGYFEATMSEAEREAGEEASMSGQDGSQP